MYAQGEIEEARNADDRRWPASALDSPRSALERVEIRVGGDAVQPRPEQRAAFEAGAAHIGPADLEHVSCQIDADDPGLRRSLAQRDGNLRGARADVENGTPAVPNGEKITDEDFIDGAMVHRIVIASFRGRVHQLGFENTRKHGMCILNSNRRAR